jgi:NifU-like protein involved in Fe-S cluster formation
VLLAAQLNGVEKMQRKATREEVELLKESGYSDKAIELYVNKVNMGVLEKPDIVETYTGPCGDVVRLYLAIGDGNHIKDAKFQCLGCPGVATAASAVTSLLKGKTIENAKKINESSVFNELGGLPDPKVDCIELVIRTLKKAIANYEKNRIRKLC